MSKSLKRVIAAGETLALGITVRRMDVSTKTAQEAADALDVTVDQIAKSIIFRGMQSDDALLFLTAGGNRVDADRAAAIAGEPLGKADAAFIREKTGFAIGGVSPIGHTAPVRSFWDPRLSQFDVIWAAAGTPHHLFEITPAALQAATGATSAAFILES